MHLYLFSQIQDNKPLKMEINPNRHQLRIFKWLTIRLWFDHIWLEQPFLSIILSDEI